jgi:hypothetical protein
MDGKRSHTYKAPTHGLLGVATGLTPDADSCVCLLVLQLVRAGRTVVVAARSAEKATEVFTEAGLQEGYQAAAAGSNGSSGILIIESGVDVTNPATLTKQLFEGVTQVGVWAVIGAAVAGSLAKAWCPAIGLSDTARALPMCCGHWSRTVYCAVLCFSGGYSPS